MLGQTMLTMMNNREFSECKRLFKIFANEAGVDAKRDMCVISRPQRVPEGTRLLNFQITTRTLLEKFYYSTE